MNATSTPNNKNRLMLVDALRCFAALWVVMFHLSEGGHIPTLIAALPLWLSLALFNAGHLGVPIFFVLSGIVMAVTTLNTPMTTSNTGYFVGRRLMRLTPPYYAAIAVGVLMIVIKQFFGQSNAQLPSINAIVAHLFYLQDFLGFQNILTVFWTLCIEIQFYLAFALLVWLGDKMGNAKARNIILLASALVALCWPTGLIQTIGWQGGFIGFWYSFMAGVLCGYVLTGQRKHHLIAAGYALVVFIIGLAWKNSFAIAAGTTAILFCLLIHTSFSLRFLSGSVIKKLALISYSLYLFHNPATGIFMRIFRRWAQTSLFSDLVAMVLAVAVSILFAAVAYALFERPAMRWSHQIRPNNKALA
jgi:peptidoglycan/LPS O-acetylase OafA/YrhL